MDIALLLAAAVQAGTPLLFATLGETVTERSGNLNLGVEGMMLMGAVAGFQVGDRVASNGTHAEFVCVPENLCAKVPENVTDEESAFAVIGITVDRGVNT